MFQKYLKALGFSGFPKAIWTISVEYLLTHLGYFAVLPILPILLNRVHELSMLQVGTIMVFFTLMVRASSMLFGGILDRLPYKAGMLGCLFATSSSFLLLPFATSLWQIYLLLAVAGAGISLNGIIAKTIASATVKEDADHVRVFGLINLFVNLAAASGPLIGTFLLGEGYYTIILLVVGSFYMAAFCLITFFLKGISKENENKILNENEEDEKRKYFWMEYYDLIFKDPEYRRMSFLNVIGWFLYAQLFTGIPLYLVEQFSIKSELGTFYTLNAVLIIAFQMTISKFVSTLQKDRGFQLDRFWGGSFLLFGIAFLIAGLSSHSILLLYLAVTVFTFGEMFFTPITNAIFSAMAKPGKRSLYFNARSLSEAIGEGIGVYLGISVFHQFVSMGQPSLYWILLGSVGILSALLTQAMMPRSKRVVTESRSFVKKENQL